MAHKQTVCIDFDNTIATYEGWGDGTIKGVPIAGAMDAILALMERGYKVIILSARPAEQIRPWLIEHWPFKMFPPPDVTNTKPPALAYIDDRAVKFDGDWKATLEIFPWNK